MAEARAEILRRLSVVIGLPEPEAAAAIGISPNKFRAMVQDGQLPRPRILDGRLVWDVEELWDAFKAFPHDGDALAATSTTPTGSETGDGWDDLLK